MRAGGREAPGDRFADAARGAGHEGGLSAEIDDHAFPLATNASSDGTSETFTSSTDESMRLIRPVSTLPGPISTKRRTPMEIISSTDSTQRTGAATWRSSALRTA